MNEKIKSYLDKGKTALGKVSKKIWIIAAVAIVIIAAALTIFLNNRPYEVLVTGSNNTELTAIYPGWIPRGTGITGWRETRSWRPPQRRPISRPGC